MTALARITDEPPRLVFITPGPLLPITNGQKSTSFRLIQQLSKSCAITVVLLIRGSDKDVEHYQTKQELDKMGISLKFLKTSSWTTTKSLLRAALSILNWRLGDMIYKVDRSALSFTAPTLFFGSCFDPFAQILGESGIEDRYFFPADSIALFQNNVRSDGLLKCTKCILTKFLERAVTTKFKKTFYVSARDAEFAKQCCNHSRQVVIPIGTEPPKQFKQYSAGAVGTTIAFSGVMNYGPNLEAARLLISGIMPLLEDRKVKLLLIGMNPPAELAELSRALPPGAVTITGAVPSIETELFNADLYVSPLLSGAGSKNKILTALGCGIPVVGTQESFSGFSSPPPGAMVCDEDPKDIAEKIIEFMDLSSEDKNALSHQARSYIIQNCSWTYSAKQLTNQLFS